jgi:sulfur-oxidizing protein SoxY
MSVVARRDVLVGAGAAAMLLALGRNVQAQAPKVEPPPPPVPSLFEQALDEILKGAKPLTGKIALEIPEIAENGNTVPYAIAIDSPMTEADHIKAIHVLSTVNPLPHVASFGFTPLSGRASVASRMRLSKTQDVVILAELSGGKFIISRRTVKVTIGGCGG